MIYFIQALRRHLSVIGVAALHLAVRAFRPAEKCPGLGVLAAVSQCGCTPADLARMAALMELKLGTETPATALNFLIAFKTILGLTGPENSALEILAADSSCSNFRPSELALVLLHLHLQTVPDKVRKGLSDAVWDIHSVCKVNITFCNITVEIKLNFARFSLFVIKLYIEFLLNF
jgi:hypothetical protein